MSASRKATVRMIPEPLGKTVAPSEEESESLVFMIADLQGIGRRENQEDTYAYMNTLDRDASGVNSLLAVVADGMGGLKGGKQASETAAKTIVQYYGGFDFADDISVQLEEAVFHANDQVINALKGAGGSTVVTVLICDDKLYFCSVGDSYLFLLRDRTLIRMNRSHNVACRTILDGVYVGKFDPQAGTKDSQKDALTHFLGQDGLDETDCLRRPFKLIAGDVILLCSDGVGGALTYPCIEKCLSHGFPKDMCAALEASVKAQNLLHQDNYTALVIQCRKK